jgi:hypothetical protein
MRTPIETLQSLLADNRAQFVSLTYTSKESGERARHTLIIGGNYVELISKSILELSLVNLGEFALEHGLDLGDVMTAHRELTASLYKSLEAHKQGQQSEDYTKAGQYVSVCAGIQMNTLDGTLEIKGVQHTKAVLEPGAFKLVNSSAKTIAKGKLNALLPRSKYRTLCLDSGHAELAKIQGETLVFP